MNALRTTSNVVLVLSQYHIFNASGWHLLVLYLQLTVISSENLESLVSSYVLL